MYLVWELYFLHSFLTFVAYLGAWARSFVTPAMMRGMSITAGILFIGFEAKALLKVRGIRRKH
ncbi:conserved protein of unknown function [Paenibacillus alvei]|uniref:Uncharacterized protein n=1 Tax=Paenibacillus alvei TaxID=44250 RepID=A0A383RAP5_PAEAL|nr:conserved protein of unknown function [Paenibacillus alvei]